MGFSGGGGGQTLPHTHDSNIVNDGGALQFNNVTQGSMAAGDITYSDGNHLQVLTYPAIPAGETLSAPALSTAPSWAAASGASGWTNEGGDSGDKAALTVTGMSGKNITKVFYHLEPSTISTWAYPMLRINGNVVNYDLVNDCVYQSGQATTVNRSTSGYFLDEESGHTSELVYFGEMTIFSGNPALAWTGNMLKNQTGSMRNDTSPALVANTIQGAGAQPDTNAITEVSLVMTAGNISGKIQVMTLDFT